MRPAVSLAEIVRQAGPELERTRPLSREQRAALCAIVRCRTPALGGHLYGCPQCGHRHLVWHSCRNRHCPRCQSQASHRWLEQRRREVLPVPYFHVVFTVPESLNAFALADPRTFYDVLFRATSRTLLDLAADPRRLGLRIGLIAVLHTWGQTLTLHPHIHCVVPAAGIAQATGRFAVARRRNFFLPVRVLSRYFRRLFLQMLGEALRTDDELRLRTGHLDRAGLFQTARAAEWVVYAKAPFAGPEQVLAYLARYTHRIAISEHRILDFDGQTVRFRWKDYRDANRQKQMQLPASEFLRRFLLHVLPRRFVRIRHYGILGNRCRALRLSTARAQLHVPAVTPTPSAPAPAVIPCPACGAPLVFIELCRPSPEGIDSS